MDFKGFKQNRIMLKKEEVFVRVSSEKKARKLKELLDMFGEKESFPGVSINSALKANELIHYWEGHFVWGDDDIVNEDDKTKVSLKELRNILSVEKLSKAKENTWYKLDDDVYQFNEKNGIWYGLFKDEWVDGMAWLQNENHHDYVEATPQEVEEALIKEAKGRGFKYDKYDYNSEENELCGLNGALESIFVDGKWAEVIKPELTLEERVKELEDAVFECSCLKSYIDGDKVILVLEKTKLR